MTPEPAGAWDFYIWAAWEFHWTPAQVAALDPDYVDELVIASRARADHWAEERSKTS